MNRAVPGPLDPAGCRRAYDLPAVRRAVRRTAFRGVALFCGGVLALTAFVVAVDHYARDSDALRTSGGSARGTVISLDPDDGIDSGDAQVRYAVAGIDYTRSVDLGSYVDNYAEGQEVTVYYDRSDPGHMTIEEEDNQPGWTVPPMIGALVGGAVLVGVGVTMLVRHVRRRHVLRGARWRQGQVVLTAGAADHGGGIPRPVFVSSDATTSRWRGVRGAKPLRVDAHDAAPRAVHLTKDTWWSAEKGRAMVISADPAGGADLVLTTRVRKRPFRRS